MSYQKSLLTNYAARGFFSNEAIMIYSEGRFKPLEGLIARLMTRLMLMERLTRFGSRVFGRPTLWQTCTSVVSHEDMDSLFPFLTKLEAHII